MKSKTSFVIVLLLIALVACAPVPPPTPTNTPTFTVTSTSTSIPATLTPQPTATISQENIPTSTPFVNEKASEDCFLKIDFTPEKTNMNEVISVWGNPTTKSSFGGDYEYWYYDFIGVPAINFNKQVIDTIRFSLKNCALEKIIAKLGVPEKIEISTLISCIGPYSWTTQNFHYPSLGFSFSRSCDETQNCFIFHPSDTVNVKEFYVSDKVIEDWLGFNSSGTVYNWHGFDVDVEEIENKIEDFDITNIVTRTPTP